MPDVTEYEAQRVKSYGQANTFDLNGMIRNYVIFMQCTSYKDVHRYVYNTIGKTFESDDFDRKIDTILNRYIATGLFSKEDDMIIWRKPKKKIMKKSPTRKRKKLASNH